LYGFVQNNPQGLIDPDGRHPLLIVVALIAVDVALLSQLSVDLQEFCCFTDAELLEAIHANNAVMDSLQRIIASDGEATFQDENLGVGGTLGATQAGNSACQRARNLFESLRNIRGYPSALRDRIAAGAPEGIPDEFSQTPDQRAELAGHLLARQQAYDRFLRRFYPAGPQCKTCEQ
jgi:hypothetical protein